MIKPSLAFLLSCVILVIIGLAPTNAAAQASIRTQAPCIGGPGASCVSFDSSLSTLTVRVFSFYTPSKGTVLASFNGSMVCRNISMSDQFLEIVGQIVTSTSAAPSVAGAGALLIEDTFKDEPDHTKISKGAYNLASERVVNYESGGRHFLYFKIAKQLMDQSVRCTIYNAVFSTVFVPTP